MNNTVSDWMDLHGISKQNAIGLLDLKIETNMCAGAYEVKSSGSSRGTAFDAKCLVLESFAWFFDDLRIEGMLSNGVSWVSDPKIVPQDGPHTLHAADNITVFCCYSGTKADLVALAHEFGHALQLAYLSGRFSPPVDREICAFFGELILLSYCETRHPKLHKHLSKVWHEETQVYLGQDLENLTIALNHPSSPYEYRQNYPVARVAASTLFSSLSAPEVWKIFKGKSGLAQAIEVMNSIKESAA